MKITDFAIIFTIIFASISIYLDNTQRKQIETVDLIGKYNEILYLSTLDATSALSIPEDAFALDILSKGDNNKLKLKPNLKKGLEQFYKTLYINFDILNDKNAQEILKGYIPVKLVVAYDGCFINTREEVWNGSKKGVEEIWLPKKSYSYYDSNEKLLINFTLDDHVEVFNAVTSKWLSGKAKELSGRINSKIFKDLKFEFKDTEFKNSYFDQFRRQIILNCVKESLEKYSVRFNTIAKNYNKAYSFDFPTFSENNFKNSINDVTFIAFMQGLIIGSEKFNSLGFGGTKISDKSKYYGDKKKVYHSDNCSDFLGSLDYVIFNNRKDAAKAGYFPCNICRP